MSNQNFQPTIQLLKVVRTPHHIYKHRAKFVITFAYDSKTDGGIDGDTPSTIAEKELLEMFRRECGK
jgi:hypothetical protein